MMKKLILVLTLASAIIGCDKTCKTTVEDFVAIQNNTGMDITLAVCKGHYGQASMRLLPTTSGIVNLGTHEETASQGGVGTCSSSNNKKNNNLKISLAPMSFGYVKLCYRQMDNTYVVASTYQGCPANYIEQTSTGACEDY
ncbi:MAG: hypothetical protein RJB66_2019 [Pseudomonadota bacterium]|jgi:hypothetical protein